MGVEHTSEVSDLPRAGLLRRLAALLYDGFLVAAIWMLVGYLVLAVAGPDTSELVEGRVQTDPLVSNIIFILMIATSAGFYIWFWTRSGQTLGMIAWRLKVLQTNNTLPGMQQSLLRFALAWPAFFIFGLGFLWLYIDPKGDTLHDRFSATKVVVVPKSQNPFQK